MGGVAIVSARYKVLILAALSLLISVVLIPLSSLKAATLPVVMGANWQYREFTDAFRQYLESTNPAAVYLSIAVAIGIIIMVIMEIFRQRREPGGESIYSSSTDTTDSGLVQKRSWARVEFALDCLFVITQSQDSQVANSKEIQGLILDLSGGGCKIATSCELQVGDELELYLELGTQQRRLALKGEVVRVDKESDNAQTFAGIMFKEIREAIRDQIITWTFKHQQTILEGKRRLAEGHCLRCGKPLPEGMRHQTVFCSKCNRIQKNRSWGY